MPDVCLYFQVHQPHRLLPAIGNNSASEDDSLNEAILNKVADRCYLPANRMFRQLIEENQGRFRMTLSLSGMAVEQFEKFRPDVLDSFRELVASGSVELLAETYYHSLAFIHSNKEFDRQVDLHLQMIEDKFSVSPRVFRNTELIYNNAIAAKAETLGFDGVLAEDISANLAGASPNFLYRAPHTARIKTLLRHHRLSDDLAFRFADPTWPGYPLTAEKFANDLMHSHGDVVNLFMNYEALGEHLDEQTGVFDFWKKIPAAILDADCQWVTPTDVVTLYRASRQYDCPQLSSWADTERDLSAWIGNANQQQAMAGINRLEEAVHTVKDPELTHLWAKLQTSDHFYWMSTKTGPDGVVHSYFSPYPGPSDAHAYFIRVLGELEKRLRALGWRESR